VLAAGNPCSDIVPARSKGRSWSQHTGEVGHRTQANLTVHYHSKNRSPRLREKKGRKREDFSRIAVDICSHALQLSASRTSQQPPHLHAARTSTPTTLSTPSAPHARANRAKFAGESPRAPPHPSYIHTQCTTPKPAPPEGARQLRRDCASPSRA